MFEMVFKIFIFILQFLFCIKCNSPNSSQVEEKLKSISAYKQRIVIIDIDQNSDQYFGKGIKFRENIIHLTNRIRKSKPSVIFFNNEFTSQFDMGEDFAKKLNQDIPTISAFQLNLSGQASNFTKEARQLIGLKIAGEYAANYEEPFKFTGMILPSIEMIRQSKMICSYVLSSNAERFVEYINPINQFDEILFENCPLTIANAILAHYQLQIIFDWRKTNHFFVSLINDKTYTRIKRITDARFCNSGSLPIQFRKFRTISAKDFMEEDIAIPIDSILIINTMNNFFKSPSGMTVSASEVLASELYTLLDLVSHSDSCP